MHLEKRDVPVFDLRTNKYPDVLSPADAYHPYSSMQHIFSIRINKKNKLSNSVGKKHHLTMTVKERHCRQFFFFFLLFILLRIIMVFLYYHFIQVTYQAIKQLGRMISKPCYFLNSLVQ